MTVELSKSEIELIDKALETWERDDMSTAMMSSMLGSMIGPRVSETESKARIRQEIEEAQDKCQQKRIKAALLRAKLFQSLARDSEHTLT